MKVKFFAIEFIFLWWALVSIWFAFFKDKLVSASRVGKKKFSCQDWAKWVRKKEADWWNIARCYFLLIWEFDTSSRHFGWIFLKILNFWVFLFRKAQIWKTFLSFFFPFSIQKKKKSQIVWIKRKFKTNKLVFDSFLAPYSLSQNY